MKKRNVLEEEKRKRSSVLVVDIPSVTINALSLVEEHKRLMNQMAVDSLHLKAVLDDLSFLFNIGTNEERKDLLNKIYKLEYAILQMKSCIDQKA